MIEKMISEVKAGFAIAGLILCIGAFSQPAAAQPLSNESGQWKQSIERPSRTWDYDGTRILGHLGFDICLWDAMTGKLLHRMKGHKEYIHAVQFSPDGHHALSSSWIGPGPMNPVISRDTRIILWNLATGRERNRFPGQVAGEFSPDGKRIVTFSQRPGTGQPNPAWGEATIPSTGDVWQLGSAPKFDAAIWEIDTGRQLVKVKPDKYSDPKRHTLHFSPDGRRFVYIENGAFLLYNSSGGVVFNSSDGREIRRVTGEDLKDTGEALKFGQGHRYTSNGALASFSRERARLIDLESGRVVQNVEHDLKPGDGLRFWGQAWTHDGGKVAAIPSGEHAIKILDLQSGKTTTGAKTGPYPKRTAIVSPDNSRLAVEWGGANNVEPGLGLYEMKTGEEIAIIQFAKFGGLIGFSPDSKSLLVGGSAYDEYISENEKRTILPEFVIYNSEDGKKIRTLKLLDSRLE